MEDIAVILAAGEGKRMHSTKPKVAHELLGKPLVRWVVDAARTAGCTRVITVVGHGREQVEPLLDDTEVVVQSEQLGTGHAIMCAQGVLDGAAGSLVVLTGDSPLIEAATIRGLIDKREATGAAAVVLTMCPPDTQGYGRIIRDDSGCVKAIVEDKDCTPEQRQVVECNSAIYCFDAQVLLSHVGRLGTGNAQGEFYLTDIIGMFRDEGLDVEAVRCDDCTEALGINSRSQLADATRIMQCRINTAFLDAGVTMLDPSLVWIGPDVTIEPDVELLPLVMLMGKTHIASGSRIGPNTRLTDCTVGHDSIVDETVAIEATIDDEVSCGPRAYLRSGTHLCDRSKAGTHVELKNSTVGVGAKVPHLSYIGDATIGERTNIGAGTITCNFDGVNKNATEIGSDAFIGSDTMLVAPVRVGDSATVGAGSTITKEVPAWSLALERSKQVVIPDWSRRKKDR